MDRELTFAGTNLGTFDAHFSNGGSFPVPARIYEHVDVLGRNGTLLIDSGKYGNVKITFPAYVYEEFRGSYNDLIEFLSSKVGYQRIEDSLEPDVYRMGAYVGGTNPSVKNSDEMGSFEITFDCKPQKFLKQNESGITVGSSSSDAVSFSNPTAFVSKPLIKMYSNSRLIINGSSFFTMQMGNLSQAGSGVNYAYVDCDTLQVYSEGGENLTGYLTINSYAYGNEKFPFFGSGGSWTAYNTVASSRDIIYPRWWKI